MRFVLDQRTVCNICRMYRQATNGVCKMNGITNKTRKNKIESEMNKYNDTQIGTLRKSRRLDDTTNAHMLCVCVRMYSLLLL